jgi:hypothetical protein
MTTVIGRVQAEYAENRMSKTPNKPENRPPTHQERTARFLYLLAQAHIASTPGTTLRISEAKEPVKPDTSGI